MFSVLFDSFILIPFNRVCYSFLGGLEKKVAANCSTLLAWVTISESDMMCWSSRITNIGIQFYWTPVTNFADNSNFILFSSRGFYFSGTGFRRGWQGFESRAWSEDLTTLYLNFIGQYEFGDIYRQAPINCWLLFIYGWILHSLNFEQRPVVSTDKVS